MHPEFYSFYFSASCICSHVFYIRLVLFIFLLSFQRLVSGIKTLLYFVRYDPFRSCASLGAGMLHLLESV